MRNSVVKFKSDESGAVTVDWVILGAAILGIGIASVASVRTGTNDLGTETQIALSGVEVASLGELGGITDMWEFTGLFVTREWMHGPGGFIDQINNWGRTPEQLQVTYDGFAHAVQRYLDAGDTRIAGLMVDHMYAIEQILNTEGVGVNSSSVSVQTAHNSVTGWSG